MHEPTGTPHLAWFGPHRWWAKLAADEPLHVGSVTNVDPRHVTLTLRHPLDPDLTTAGLIMKAFNDPAIDVRKRGIVGWPQVKVAYEHYLGQKLTMRWVRELAERDDTLRFVGRHPVRSPGTTLERVRAHCAAHVSSEQASHRNAAEARWGHLETLTTAPGRGVDVGAGSNARPW
jgi:hypothetical protein